MMEAYLTGFTAGAGLILAIGSQNAFVLRQGIRGEYVNSVCLVCAVSDAILIAFGVAGFQTIIAHAAWLEPVLLYLGVAFLTLYGAQRLYAAAFAEQSLAPVSNARAGMLPTLGVCLALTWLNPHVYLDTVILLGAISTQFVGNEIMFACGAATASFLFFFMLGHSASLLRPIFAKANAWRVLDLLVGLAMWMIAVKLLPRGILFQ